MAKRQNNSAEKEAKRLLEEKIASMPLDSKSRLHVIGDNMENALKLKEQKIAMLVKAIDKSFPPGTPNRGFYEAFASLSFDTAYSLYLQNNNSALVVELQGILERSCLNSLEDMLPIDDIAKDIIIDVLSKKTLSDVAPYFVKYGIWDKNDKDFAMELTKLRNGIAHKNAEIVSRSKLVKGSGQDRHYESIHSLMNKMDCTSFIIKTMELMVKASGMARPSFIKQPRLYSRYRIYTSLAPELYNLFMTNPFVKGHDPRLELYINERMAMAYIVGSEELVEKLQSYRNDVLLFHKAMADGDLEKSQSIYDGFDSTLHEVRMAMRKDLQVDWGDKELLGEFNLIDVKPYMEKSRKLKKVKEGL